MAQNNVDLAENDASLARAPLGKAQRRRKLRQEEVYRLHLQGRTIRETATLLGVGTRTVDRDLAEIRQGRRMEFDRNHSITRDVARSLDEKLEIAKRMWQILDRPPRRTSKGDVIDETRDQISAANVLVKVSRSIDQLLGLENVALRRELDELKLLYESTKRNRRT